jgi:hypothetical protein
MAAFDYRQAQEIRDAFATHAVRYLFIGKSGAIQTQGAKRRRGEWPDPHRMVRWKLPRVLSANLCGLRVSALIFTRADGWRLSRIQRICSIAGHV